jgi:release factor glutamine methyltransferase
MQHPVPDAAEPAPGFWWRLTRLQGLPTLADKPEENPRSTLYALWHLAAGRPVSVQVATNMALDALASDQLQRLDNLIAQRLAGTPLAHLTGRQRFMDLELLAGPEALIPRAETELLGRAALSVLRARSGAILRVADACTGAGNLAVGLAHHEPRSLVWAIDLSLDAVTLARRNVEQTRLHERVQVLQGDLLEPLRHCIEPQSLDLIVCNPPYISSARVDSLASEIACYEPRLAFDGGPFGVRILQRLMREAPHFLRPSGHLAFEVGAGQGKAVLERLRTQSDYVRIDPVTDALGEVRAFVAERRA